MAKHDNDTRQANGGKTTNASGAMTGEAIEQRLTAFAEQLGRMAGTIQAKAEGWLDRETLHTQISSVRDGAAHLLMQLARAAKTPANKPAATARTRTKGRSGGVVDAPGKRHRKPAPTDPVANLAKSQSSKVRAAKTMAKTNRNRGRG